MNCQLFFYALKIRNRFLKNSHGETGQLAVSNYFDGSTAGELGQVVDPAGHENARALKQRDTRNQLSTYNTYNPVEIRWRKTKIRCLCFDRLDDLGEKLMRA